MLDTIVAFLWNSDMGGHTFVGDEAKEERAQSFIDLIYETADSYISVAAMHDKHWRGLAKALNRPDFLEDKRFKTPELRDINVDDRLNVTQEALRPHTTDDLLTLLEANDVPCAPVLTRTQMRQHPQIHANGIIIELDHPQAGRLRQARPPAVFSKTKIEMRRGAPVYGADTATVLAETGYGESEISAMFDQGAAIQAGSKSDAAD